MWKTELYYSTSQTLFKVFFSDCECFKRKDHPRFWLSSVYKNEQMWVSWTDWQLSRPRGCPGLRTATADGGHGGSRPGGWEADGIITSSQMLPSVVGADTMLGVEKEDTAGYEIMEPVSMEDPGSEVKGLRCHPRISRSLTHQTLLPAWCPPLHTGTWSAQPCRKPAKQIMPTQ